MTFALSSTNLPAMRNTQLCKRCGGTGRLPTSHHLKARRKKSGAGLRAVAELMKISASYLCLLENGKHGWTADMVNRFEVAMGQIALRETAS